MLSVAFVNVKLSGIRLNVVRVRVVAAEERMTSFGRKPLSETI